MENPTLVFLTERNDLDDQLFGQFQRCHEIVRQNFSMLQVVRGVHDNVAAIYALVSERDSALEQLAALVEVPNGPTRATLRAEPEWDSLRGDPRFEKMVASVVPKKW